VPLSPPMNSLPKDPSSKKQGRLAVVTGASSGLGAEFARRWAERAFDVALVARRKDLTSLTEAMWQEQRGTGLTVLALCPGPTATGFFEAAGSDAFAVGSVATIDSVVRAAFASLDRPDSGPTLTVGFRNRLTGSLAGLAPQRISLAVAARLTSGARE